MPDPKSLTNEQLDIWLAEHAMGEPIPSTPPYLVNMEAVSNNDNGHWKYTPGRDKRYNRCVGVWSILTRFSADPAASKQLTDALETLGWCWDVTVVLGVRRARLWRLPKESTIARANADTVMRAIAEAAYLALEARK